VSRPHPYWERTDVIAANNQLLNLVGSSWDNPLPWLNIGKDPFEFMRSERKWLAVHGLVRDVAARLTGNTVVKDPRFSLTLPVWLRYLRDVSIVFVYRRPDHVAFSLKQRDSMPFEVGLALWEVYCRQALSCLPSLPSVCVSYESLTLDYRKALTDIGTKLFGSGWEVSESAVASVVSRPDATQPLTPDLVPVSIFEYYSNISEGRRQVSESPSEWTASILRAGNFSRQCESRDLESQFRESLKEQVAKTLESEERKCNRRLADESRRLAESLFEEKARHQKTLAAEQDFYRKQIEEEKALHNNRIKEEQNLCKKRIVEKENLFKKRIVEKENLFKKRLAEEMDRNKKLLEQKALYNRRLTEIAKNTRLITKKIGRSLARVETMIGVAVASRSWLIGSGIVKFFRPASRGRSILEKMRLETHDAHSFLEKYQAEEMVVKTAIAERNREPRVGGRHPHSSITFRVSCDGLLCTES
jgi:hypothetical protein